MSLRRSLLVVLWVLSLTTAAQLGARAQQPPTSIVGSEVRFVPTGVKDGVTVGTLTAQVNGQWVLVQVAPGAESGPRLRPAGQ